MNKIKYAEWESLFEVSDESAAETDAEISDNPDQFTFYSNGAVWHQEAECFVIKCDQVKRKAHTA